MVADKNAETRLLQDSVQQEIIDLDTLQASGPEGTVPVFETIQVATAEMLEAVGVIAVGSSVSVEKWWTTNRVGAQLGLSRHIASKVAKTFQEHYRHLVWRDSRNCRVAPEAMPALQIIKDIIYPDPPEGWMTLSQIAQTTGRSQSYITSRVAKICATRADWQQVLPHGDREISYFDPAILSAVPTETNRPDKQAPEGWMSRNAIAKVLGAAHTTVAELAAPLLDKHPEWKQNCLNGRGRSYEYLSPELVAAITQELSQYEDAPTDWRTASALGRSLKMTKGTVNQLADTYLNEHPEWFKTYWVNNQLHRHFHPNLVAALTGKAKQAELPSGQWEKRADLARRIGTTLPTVRKYAEPYRKEHPEWFGSYTNRLSGEKSDGRASEHYHPHLVMILESRLGRLANLPLPPPGWVTVSSFRRQVPVDYVKLNKVVDILRGRHPGWVKPYKVGTGKAANHLSPELHAQIRAMTKADIDALIESREGPKQHKTRRDKLPPRPPKPKKELSGREQQKVLACIACMHVCLEGDAVKELRPYNVQACTSVTQVTTHSVFRIMEEKGRITRQPPGKRYGYFTLTAAGLRFLANRKPADTCSSGRRDPAVRPLRLEIPAVILPGSPEAKSHAYAVKPAAETTPATIPAVETLPNRPLNIVATPEQREFLFEFWKHFEAFCIKLDRQQGLDIAQSVRIKFLTKVPAAVNIPATMRSWLFTTARNEHIGRWRKNERHNRVTDPEDFRYMAAGEPAVDAGLIQSATREEAAAVIAALPRLLTPKQWQLVEKLYVHGKDMKEVAAELSIGIEAVRTRKTSVWKTIQRIAKKQEEDGVDLGLPSTDFLKELLAAKKRKSRRET